MSVMKEGKPLEYVDFNHACIDCSAYTQTYLGMVPISMCAVAVLDNKSDSALTFLEAERENIDTSDILDDCPNNYRSHKKLPVRKQD